MNAPTTVPAALSLPERLTEDRRVLGEQEIRDARASIKRAMSYLDLSEFRGAHAILGNVVLLLDEVGCEVER